MRGRNYIISTEVWSRLQKRPPMQNFTIYLSTDYSRLKFLETLIKNIMYNYCACKNNKFKGVMLCVCVVCLKEALLIIKCEVYP